jgi:hypothetical protein
MLRSTNLGLLDSRITIWLTLVQWAGVGIYMPIYYAAYTFVSDPETYWWPLNREVPIQYARSLIWAIMIGYTLPTILMFWPWESPYAIQNFESLWQPCPVFVPIICSSLGYYYVKKNKLVPVSRTAKESFPDLPHLKLIYVITGALGFMLHSYTIIKILSSSELSLKSVFWPDFAAQPKDFGEGLRALFLVDFWGFHVASYAWLCMGVWDLKRMGRSAVDMGKASALIALSSFIIGPGATMSAVWYWRENALARTSFGKGHA